MERSENHETQSASETRGRTRIHWAERNMPALHSIRAQFGESQPLAGIRIAACLHVTAETAALVRTLASGGAEVRLCASNPLSTQDDVVASLSEHDGIAVFARRGVDRKTYYEHIDESLAHAPHILMDDGADLARLIHTKRRDLLDQVIGGTEETTTGVVRLRSMARESVLAFPVIAVNQARTKHHFDNRYGTGQSVIDGVLRATNRLIAGSVFVVAGYGWCGRGVAMRAAGMGAQVVVTEVDPLRGLEALMEGYRVMPIAEAAPIGDFFCTVTGNARVIGEAEFLAMKNGAIVCNAGHFDVELDVETLGNLAEDRKTVREGVDEFRLNNGKSIFLLGGGRLVNLATAEGHPPDIMDLSFANQALSVKHLIDNADSLEVGVLAVPEEIDRQVAALKLDGLGIHIDQLTADQQRYMTSWQLGT